MLTEKEKEELIAKLSAQYGKKGKKWFIAAYDNDAEEEVLVAYRKPTAEEIDHFRIEMDKLTKLEETGSPPHILQSKQLQVTNIFMQELIIEADGLAQFATVAVDYASTLNLKGEHLKAIMDLCKVQNSFL